MRNAFFFILMLLTISSRVSSEEDYYTKNNICRFADFLFTNSEYDRAVGEYLRAASLCGPGAFRDSVFYRVAVSCCYTGKPESARKFSRMVIDNGNYVFSDQARCLMAYTYFQMQEYDSLLMMAPAIEPFLTGPVWKVRLMEMESASLLKRNRWGEAKEACRRILMVKPQDSQSIVVDHCATEGEEFRGKSPIVAGLLSGVIPGSGKLYAHRGWDGFFSLLIVGTMGWQSYEAYEKAGPLSSRFLIFGALSLIFYAGNIYGSANAAEIYNHAQLTAITSGIDPHYAW